MAETETPVARTASENIMAYEQRAAQARRLAGLCTDNAARLILRRLADDYATMALRERQKLEGAA